MVRKLFAVESKTVTSAAFMLAAASLVSRFVGVFRDRMLSGTFGAHTELDAYYAAFRTPDLVYNLFVLGAVTAGFIPVFTAVLNGKDDGKRGDAFISSVLTLLGCILAAAGVIGLVAAPKIVPLLAPGFDGELAALTVRLTRVMFLSPVFLGLSSVLGSVLQVRRRFLAFSLAPILYNLSIIAGTVVLSGRMGIMGPTIGVVAGSFLHFALQAAACGWSGFRFAWRRPRIDADVMRVAALAAPRAAGLAVSQVNLFVLTGIASMIGAGSIAVFSLANNLQSFPIGIIGVSFAVAAFPLIAELAARGEKERFVEAFGRTVRTILFLAIPCTVLLLLLRAQIVRVILGTGVFDWKDTIETADTLAFFTLSLFAQALLPLVVRAFFAFQDSMTPLVVAVAAAAVQPGLAWYFSARGMGIEGLALAFSVGSILQLVGLWIALRIRVGDLGERKMVRSILLMSAAAFVMVGATQATKIAVAGFVDMRTFVGIFSQGITAGLVGIATYVALAFAMGSEEARDVVRLYRRHAVPAESGVVQDDGTLSVE